MPGAIEECVRFTIVSDDVIEGEEQFAVELLVNSGFATVVESTTLVIITTREQGEWRENLSCVLMI